MSHHAPAGYHTVTPWIVPDDSLDLIDYMREAFDAVALGHLRDEHGRVVHAEVRIGDSVIML